VKKNQNQNKEGFDIEAATIFYKKKIVKSGD
jgi:hypothetical protein